MKHLTLVMLLVMGESGVALAQERQQPRDPYITSTGETVPNPGKSQSGGTTPLDRGIQHQDNKIDRSICKGC